MSNYFNIAPRRSIAGPAMFIVGGGMLIGAGVYYAVYKSKKTVEGIEKAVAGTAPPAQIDVSVEPPTPQTGTGGYVDLRLTGYWPFTAKESEKKMEGGVWGAAVWNNKKAIDPATGKRPYLMTVEQHREDPAKYPYVSLSGDDALWPLGQKVIIPWVDGKPIIGRVVDTGSHFRGTGKIYRIEGREPIDIAVNSKSTKVPAKVTAQIVPFDNWEGRAIATGGFKGQTVAVGEVLEGRTSEDHEALARAIESELGDRTREEQVAGAWAMRNRADKQGVSIRSLLAPRGFGSPRRTGGYASTRKAPTSNTRAIADEVLGALPEEDPTKSAIEFWMPSQQEKLRKLGDVYRAASAIGDDIKAKRYEKYAAYGSESDVRLQQAADGLRVLGMVGVIELLGI